MPPPSGPFRAGEVHVRAERCATCIFRSVNDGRIHLRPGRVAEMVVDARASETAIVCHETYDAEQAVCRGFFDLPRPTQPLQVAERLGLLAFDSQETRGI